MTQKELLIYAYDGAFKAWAREDDKLSKNPDDIITRYLERKHMYALNEIYNMLKEIEEA